MEEITNEIRLSYTDREVNELLESAAYGKGSFTRHFDYQESMFLRLPGEYVVPRLLIHHDVRNPQPHKDYLGKLKEILPQMIRLAPEVFQETTYLFDPRETLKPAFFKLYRIDNNQYLYLVQIDLMFRAQEHTLLERGNNDLTSRYSSNNLFLEAAFIPLENVETVDGKVHSFSVKQMISNTWIGEVGRGYFVQGIWMDHELTKFFSKLFLPQGKRIYPYYPFTCTYKTICHNVLYFSPEERRHRLPFLHRAIHFLAPAMARIEQSMKSGTFSEENETFQELKQRVPTDWQAAWQNIRLVPYLNERDMKEYRVED